MLYFQSVDNLLSGAVLSCPGGRGENQDDFGFADTPLGFAAVVCDGMGGGPGGKTASAIVRQEIIETLCECNPLMDRVTALKMACSNASEALEKVVAQNPALVGMGSTVVAVIVNRQSAVIAHVGDSRCYRLGGNRVKFCTDDHSLVAELVKKKVMTAEQARISPQSNVITRHIGNPVSNTPQTDVVAFRKGDRFVLCTDGVWGIMPHEQLVSMFSSVGYVGTVVEGVSQNVDRIGFGEGGGHDNHTVLMFEVSDNSLLKDVAVQRRRLALWVSGGVLATGIFVSAASLVRCDKPKEHDADVVAFSENRGEGSNVLIFEKDKGLQGIADSLQSDTAPIVKQIEELAKLKREKDSLRVDTVRHEKSSVHKKNGSPQNGTKQKKTAQTEKDCTSRKRQAIEIIGKIKENLNAIKECRGKTAEDVATTNGKKFEAVKKKMSTISKLEIAKQQDFINNVCKYVNDKGNMKKVCTATSSSNGSYNTSKDGLKVVRQIMKDLDRLEESLKPKK